MTGWRKDCVHAEYKRDTLCFKPLHPHSNIDTIDKNIILPNEPKIYVNQQELQMRRESNRWSSLSVLISEEKAVNK